MMRSVVQHGARYSGGKPSAREREMYRLRTEERRSLREIGERFELSGERVRQLLAFHFGLTGGLAVDGDRSALVALGDACRQFREQRGLSLVEVAGRTGIANDRLTALEAGQLDADIGLLKSLASSVGVPLSTILAEAEELERRAST